MQKHTNIGIETELAAARKVVDAINENAPSHSEGTRHAATELAQTIERIALDALVLRALMERTPEERAAFVRRVQELDE